jgi:hypothetical protein
MPPSTVEKSHREDFAAMLRQRSRSADNFDLTATPWHIEADQPTRAAVVFGPIASSVIVKSKRNGGERTYPVRNSISSRPFVDWVYEAARDVDAGVFG